MRFAGRSLPAIGQIASDNEGDLLSIQFLDGNLQWIRLALDINQHRRVHTDLQRSGAQDPRTLVLCQVRRRRPLFVGYTFCFQAFDRHGRPALRGGRVAAGLCFFAVSIRLRFSVRAIIVGAVVLYDIFFLENVVFDIPASLVGLPAEDPVGAYSIALSA